MRVARTTVSQVLNLRPSEKSALGTGDGTILCESDAKRCFGAESLRRLPMDAQSFVDELLAQGRNSFVTEEALRALAVRPEAGRAQLRRLVKARRLVCPVRSFYVVLPPEYRRQGSPPAEHFIDPLMRFLERPYYLGLLSAAERHGAAHQRPQATQLMVDVARPTLQVGAVQVDFIGRKGVAHMPVQESNTPYGTLRCATAELTALELVGYPGHAGGLNNVATVLDELAEAIDASALRKTAQLCPVGWAQRLGYLLEMLGIDGLAAGVAEFVAERSPGYIPLRRAADARQAPRSAKWRVVVNVDVEPDA
jgi:predicted transcriptional regulator of viral defense system